MARERVRGSQKDRTLIESFLDMMSAERGAASNTLTAYRRDLLDFARDCTNAQVELHTASREHVKKHLASLSAAALKPSSQARKLSALRRFYAFLYAEGVRSDDPCGAIDTPRLSRPLPKILSADEVLKLVEAARTNAPDGEAPSPESARLLCIVEML
jgi:integrase/recombinase XerD